MTAPEQPKTQSGLPHIGHLDGLRGCAAVMVVIGHCAEVAGEHAGARSWLLSSPINYLTSLCVPAFIVLSGFCLTLPVIKDGVLRGGWREFFKRRVRRIFPAYYLALTLSIIAAIYVTHDLSKWSVLGLSPSVLWPALMLHDVTSTPITYNRPLWSMPVEAHCYLTFPLLVFFWRRSGVLKTTLIAMLLAWCAQIVLTGYNLQGITPIYYVLFFGGALAAWVAYSDKPSCVAIRARSEWRTMAPAFLALLAFMCVLGGRPALLNDQRVVTVFAGAWTVFALISIAAGNFAATRDLLSSRIADWIGVRSYSLYVLHFIVLNLIAYKTDGWHIAKHTPAYFLLLLLTTLPLSLLASAISYALIERPFMTRRAAAKARTDIAKSLASSVSAPDST